LITKRFRKKIDRPCFHRLHRHRNITMTGHEYDRHAQTAFCNMLLNGEAIFAAQPDIEDQATRRVVLREVEEIQGRFKRLYT
jgi:hypothetical protein